MTSRSGVGEGQGAEQDGVHHGEDGEIRAEADGERHESGGCEPGVLRSRPCGVAELPAEFIERLKPARFAALFLNAVQAAELDAGAPCGLCRRDAGADEVVRVLIDMKLEFLGHAVLEIVAGFQHTQE